jgi:hypothetical protein
MRKLFLLLLVLATCLVASPLSLFAQGEDQPVTLPDPLCGKLSEADCAIRRQSVEAVRQLTAIKQHMEFSFTLADLPIPDLPIDNFTIQVVMDMATTTDPALNAELLRLQFTPPSDIGVYMETLQSKALELYKKLTMDVRLQIKLPQELIELLNAEAKANGDEFAMPSELDLQVRMTDGIAYLDLGALTAQLPDFQGEKITGWLGLDMVALMQASLEQQKQIQQQLTAESSPLLQSQMALQAVIQTAMYQALLSQEVQDLLNRYFQIKRGKDATIDERTAATFRSSFNLVGFLTNPALNTLIRDGVHALAEQIVNTLQESGMDKNQLGQLTFARAQLDQQMDQALAMVPLFASLLFGGLKIENNVSYDVENSYLLHSDGRITWNLASLAAAAQLGAPELALPPGIKPKVTMSWAMDYSDFDKPVTVNVPDDVFMLPVEEILRQQALQDSGDCRDQLTITLSGDELAEYEAVLTPTEMAALTLQCPQTVPVVSKDQVRMVSCNSREIIIANSAPTDVEVVIKWPSGEATASLHPTYTLLSPNGKNAAPHCLQATEEIMVK